MSTGCQRFIQLTDFNELLRQNDVTLIDTHYRSIASAPRPFTWRIPKPPVLFLLRPAQVMVVIQ